MLSPEGGAKRMQASALGKKGLSESRYLKKKKDKWPSLGKRQNFIGNKEWKRKLI